MLALWRDLFLSAGWANCQLLHQGFCKNKNPTESALLLSKPWAIHRKNEESSLAFQQEIEYQMLRTRRVFQIPSCKTEKASKTEEKTVVEDLPVKVKGEEVTYATDSTKMKGYIAFDENKKDPFSLHSFSLKNKNYL